jgi:regulator of replication initiation timing
MPYHYTDENGIYTIHAWVDTPPTARRARERAFAPEPEEFQATEIDGEHINTGIGVGATKGKLSKAILRELGKLPKTKKHTKRLVIVADIPENDALKEENEKMKKAMADMAAYITRAEKENDALKKENEKLKLNASYNDKLIAERLTDVSFFPYDEREVKEMIGSEYDQDGNCDWEFTCDEDESADNWFNEFKERAVEMMNDSYGEMTWKDAVYDAMGDFIVADGEGGVKWTYF